MKNCLIQIQNCFDLLIPSVDFFDIIREESSQIVEENEDSNNSVSEDSDSGIKNFSPCHLSSSNFQ